MKKVIFAAAILFAGITTATAQTQEPVKKQNKADMVMEQNEKTINPEELPTAVQTALKSKAYDGWKVVSAKVMEVKGTKMYKVNVTDGKETKDLTFDEKGQKVA
jgi:hypothetical protein